MKPRRAALCSGFLGFLLQPICIESGLDIPTISRWLGHSDGGAWPCGQPTLSEEESRVAVFEGWILGVA
jgi:hypothetical protein